MLATRTNSGSEGLSGRSPQDRRIRKLGDVKRHRHKPHILAERVNSGFDQFAGSAIRARRELNRTHAISTKLIHSFMLSKISSVGTGTPNKAGRCRLVSMERPHKTDLQTPSITWPEPPSGAVARVVYRNLTEPIWRMVCHRFADGTLRPMGTNTLWMPPEGSEFILEFEESLVSRT